MGYIALEDIEIGTLILKEKSQCPKIGVTDVNSGLHSFDDYLFSLMDFFFSMNKNDQEEYLMLYNKFLDPNSISAKSKYFYWKRFAQVHEEKWISNARFHVDRNLILKIICIYQTNAYYRGVGFKSSRFNHSCSPNSENSDMDICTGEMKIRASFKIKKGEEICINYFCCALGMKNKKGRRDHLQGNWGFICSCERCQDEDINNDDETYEQFQKLQEEAEKNAKKAKIMKISESMISCQFDFIEKAISCLKQMFNLAEQKKAPKHFIYTMILSEWFYLEATRHVFAKNLVSVQGLNQYVGKMEYFKGECKKLTKIMVQLAKTITGNDSTMTRDCKEKSKQFEN